MVTVLDPCGNGGGGGITPSQVQQMIDNSIAKYRINVFTLTEEERAWVLENLDMCIFYYYDENNTENKYENDEIRRRENYIYFDFPARANRMFIDDLTIEYNLLTGEERKIWKPYVYDYSGSGVNNLWFRMRQRLTHRPTDPTTNNFSFRWYVFKNFLTNGIEMKRFFYDTGESYFYTGLSIDASKDGDAPTFIMGDCYIADEDITKDDVYEAVTIASFREVKMATVDYVDGIEAELATI